LKELSVPRVGTVGYFCSASLGADSQKAALGIHLKDLADYIDRQREKAAKEQNQLMGRAANNGIAAKGIRPDILYHHP
ncbi:pyocin activator PrtN family protein, partial [Pseudomonas amygdali]|uniref:pyocin activator PrtN family protein n=1 Tax=Pseudomonas amygdali TaxID=47877 RepID=UPI001939FDD7